MKLKRIIDVSRRISSEMVIWPGDKKVVIERDCSISNGDCVNLSHIRMGLHTGTHVDAPLHIADGAQDIASVSVEYFFGFVKVFELDVEDYISKDDVKDLSIKNGDAVFFKTRNSYIEKDEFNKDFIYLDTSAAEYLVAKGVKTVGVDYLSVESFASDDLSVHKLLLLNKIAVVEGLMLKDVREGEYIFSCLPLPVDRGDGSPVRAVLAEFEC